MKHLLAIAIAAVAAASVQAVTVIPITFEELVQQSDAVVYARVADVQGRWTADRRNIESVVTAEPLRYLKGNLGEQVVMRLPGGEAGGMLQVLPGAPVLRQGDLVVLFLAGRGPAIPSPVGLTQGIFRVSVETRSGGLLVAPPPLKASAAGRQLRGAVDRRALTLDVFAQEVSTIAGGQR